MTHGKVLLVGHMGLYDYRPYVKRITNNRQILFDCDRGYNLKLGQSTSLGGPPLDITWSGVSLYTATCIISQAQ